jgi:hypothetical protein
MLIALDDGHGTDRPERRRGRNLEGGHRLLLLSTSHILPYQRVNTYKKKEKGQLERKKSGDEIDIGRRVVYMAAIRPTHT